MIKLLERKFSTYLKYARSGVFRKEYPQASKARWQIVWSFDGKLDRRSEDLVESFVKRCRQSGGDFKLHSVGEAWSWSYRN